MPLETSNKKAICLVCGVNETKWENGPPWDPAPRPEICAGCENKMLEAAEADIDKNITAAMRSGRFDLL